MDDAHVPSWMHTFELVMVVLATLSILSVIMIIMLHVWFRPACFSIGIC